MENMFGGGYFLLLLLALGISAVSQILLKKAAIKKYKNVIYEYLNRYVMGAYLLYAAALLMTTICYRGLQYKVIAILESFGYVLVMLLARIFLKEKITAKKMIGICLITAGILIFNL